MFRSFGIDDLLIFVSSDLCCQDTILCWCHRLNSDAICSTSFGPYFPEAPHHLLMECLVDCIPAPSTSSNSCLCVCAPAHALGWNDTTTRGSHRAHSSWSYQSLAVRNLDALHTKCGLGTFFQSTRYISASNKFKVQKGLRSPSFMNTS